MKEKNPPGPDRIKMFTVGDSFDSMEHDFNMLPPAPLTATQQQRPPTPSTIKAPKSKLVNHMYHEYCMYTTIHGVQYLGQKRPFREKIVWIVALLISICFCTHLIYNTYIKWVETPVIVSFSEKSTPVWNIPFPAVTICSETKSIRNETFDFTQFYRHLMSFGGRVYEKPSNMSQIDLNRMRSLLQICGNHLVSDMNFPNFEQTNFEERLDEIVPQFERNFPFCKWVTHLGNCEDVFFKTYTEEGVCYTFNGLNASEIYRENTYQHIHYLSTQSSKSQKRKHPTKWSLQEGYDSDAGIETFPARVLGAGSRASLVVSLQSYENDFDYICRGALEGFKVTLHSPDDVPQVSRNFIRVPYDKEVVVLVKPNMIETMNAISDYEPSRRQCFFNNERYLKFFKIYTQSNCELECLSNYTLSKCGCVKFSMPRSPHTPVCDEKKIHCYDLAEDDLLIHEFGEGLNDPNLIDSEKKSKCNCLPSCTSLVYNTELSQGNYNMQKMLASHGDTQYMAENVGVRMSRLSMHFKENQFITSKRSELYGITDFVANCGGLLGLFMGFSALSIVEFFYYATVRLMTNIQDARRV
ncbi:pickpocket protein 28 [Episyrphus balteatus]|uniref:pickpocket protein 28 n=1 Tax=Episyrphus balteatus TaxID=286459 RepID=UPI00248604A2|nr:pickpocket protein 28 [Episyrphus balteatus]